MTADYMMVNSTMSEILNSGVNFQATDNHRVYKPGQNQGQIIQDDQVIAFQRAAGCRARRYETQRARFETSPSARSSASSGSAESPKPDRDS